MSQSPERRFCGLFNVVGRNASPGLDSIEIGIMGSEMLFEAWVALFEVC